MLIVGSLSASAKLVYPDGDLNKISKQEALTKMNELMGPNGSSQLVVDSDKIILWANKAAVIPKTIDGQEVYESTELPSFTPVTDKNRDYLHQLIEKQCACTVEKSLVAGVLIADPFKAAVMYLRRGWAGHTGDEIDGKVPPIIIMYHEFSHAKDYLSNAEWFFDMAASFDKRWMNKAEESACTQQNDMANMLSYYDGIHVTRRRSYGKNKLYDVDHFLSF